MSRQGSAAGGKTIEQLRGTYGGFPVVEERTTVPREALVDCMTSASEGRLGGARTLLQDGGQTLLVRYRENPSVWDLPGGSLDRHENHEQSAERHVAEQLDVECALTGAFHARRQTFSLVDGGEGTSGLWIYFEAEPLGASRDIETCPDVVEARWFDEPPEAIEAPIYDRIVSE